MTTAPQVPHDPETDLKQREPTLREKLNRLGMKEMKKGPAAVLIIGAKSE